MHKPNKLLEADVLDQFAWDPLLDSTRVVVSAKDGRVSLTGSVPTYYDVSRAADDAKRVSGVTSIDNQLLVGLVGDAITDGELAVAAAAALDADKFVPKDGADVEVVEGWLTLRGEVRHHYQRLAAEHAVGRLDGILGVTDKIAITSDPIPSDVAYRIQQAFKRNAIVDDTLIEVSNSGPIIYLDGMATSWTARQEAEDTAWDAPGVVDVVNRLTVVP